MSAHAGYGDVPVLKSVHPIQDVIAFCFGVKVYDHDSGARTRGALLAT